MEKSLKAKKLHTLSKYLDHSVTATIFYLAITTIYFFTYVRHSVTYKASLSFLAMMCLYYPAKRHVSSYFVRSSLYTSALYLTITTLCLLTGGPQSPFFFWYPVIVIASVILCTQRQTVTWMCLCVCSYFIFYFGSPHMYFENIIIPQAHSFFNFASNTIMVSYLAVCHLSLNYVHRKLEKEKARMIQKSSQTEHLKALGEIAGGVAHEINNPLAIISGSANAIKKNIQKDKPNREKLLKQIDVINRTVRRATHIVQGMKNLSKDNSTDQKEYFVVGDALQDVLSFLSKKIQASNITVTHDEGNRLWEKSVYFQRIQLSQVLINLINNSFDAIEKQNDPWIKISVHNRMDSLEIRVEDSGAPIPQSHRDKLFQPLYTTKPIGEGVGLGLSLSHTMMNQNGGTITLASQEQTCFILKVPYHEAKEMNQAA